MYLAKIKYYDLYSNIARGKIHKICAAVNGVKVKEFTEVFE